MKSKLIPGNWFSRFFKPSERESSYLHKGEILVVFLIGYLIAIFLWLLVNLGREYNVMIEIPLEVSGYSEDMAFTESPPEKAQIGVIGEGWNLLFLYRNPPVVTIAYDEGMVSLSELIQEQLSTYPDLTVQKVEPPFITVDMEPKIEIRVPVSPDLDIQLSSQYEIRGEVSVTPDSVTITGAESVLDTLTNWPTETLRLRNVQERVEQRVNLIESELIVDKDTSDVLVQFDVNEFTEGEIRIYVRARNIPEERQIRFNPSVLNVKYDVPIEHFSEAQEMVPYEAIVYYEDIVKDTTGFVVPSVRPVVDDLKLQLRSFQPRRVSYFWVINE